MHVLNVIDGTGWCGTKEQTYLISTLLKKRGIDSELALAENHLEMINRINGQIKLHFYGKHEGGKSRFNPKNILKLRKIIKEGNYDVVIAHSSHALDYVLLATLLMTKKPKLVAVRRSGYVPGRVSRLMKYKLTDKIVVVSKDVARLLKEKNFFPEKLEVIESGIDLSRFKPNTEQRNEVRQLLGLKDDELLFVNIANWQPWRKGQEVILKALKQLPIENFKAVFVGLNTDSPEALKTYEKYGLQDKCVGLGFRQDIDKILQGADLFLFGSFSEGIAGAVLQAMATGKIVVSTAAGGIPEYLKDGYNGFLVDIGDYKAMARKIMEALNLSPQKKEKIITNAIKTASEYSIDRTVDKYVELINELTKTS
ncbi:MAG: glycosyltransferase family 4 protein [Aquificae bacterium]|nr:glycosyltransferase family 4 protein [Aquificota bacterium]